MNAATNEGGVNTARPFNIFTTNSNNEVGMNTANDQGGVHTACPLDDLTDDNANDNHVNAIDVFDDEGIHDRDDTPAAQAGRQRR